MNQEGGNHNMEAIKQEAKNLRELYVAKIKNGEPFDPQPIMAFLEKHGQNQSTLSFLKQKQGEPSEPDTNPTSANQQKPTENLIKPKEKKQSTTEDLSPKIDK